MPVSIANIIPVLIIFQSALFAFVLFTDKGPKKASNRLLAFFLIILAIQFSCILSEGINGSSPRLEQLLCIFGFAYGPLLYLYAISLIYEYFVFKPVYLLHFLPVVAFLPGPVFACPLCSRFGLLMYASLVIYISMAIRAIVFYRRIVLNTHSETLRTDLKWLQWTMVIFSCALFFDLINHFVFILDIVWGISIIHLAILFLINWMFYKGLKQPQIFLGISQSDQSVIRRNLEEITADDQSEKLEMERIRKYLEEYQPYTNPKLALSDLADQLKIPMRHLSYLINTYSGQNFMGFINHYRIELAKQRFQHPKDPGETILEVMYEVGFNSKSSFNTIFKQRTGLTPSEFKLKYTA